MPLRLFTTPTCAWCKKTKEWLKKKKISYQEIDVVESESARDEMLEKTAQLAVPVIELNGVYMVGFDEAKLEKILAKNKD